MESLKTDQGTSQTRDQPNHDTNPLNRSDQLSGCRICQFLCLLLPLPLPLPLLPRGTFNFQDLALPMIIVSKKPYTTILLSGVDGLGDKKILYISRYLLHIIRKKNKTMDLLTSQLNRTTDNSNNTLEQN